MIMGVDPSTKSGVVVLGEGGKLESSCLITFPGKDGIERVQLIANAIRSVAECYEVTEAWIEGYAYNNTHTMATLVEIGTGIRLALVELDIRLYDVQPTVLKRWTTGKGGAPKDLMAQHVKERWQFTSKYDDVVDAYALAQYGRANGVTS